MRKLIGAVCGGAILATHHVLVTKNPVQMGFGPWLISFMFALGVAGLVMAAVEGRFNKESEKDR